MDPAVLRQYWHPVASSDQVTSLPFSCWLLDEPLVLFRDPDGSLAALRDRCAHRGTALSRGWVEDGKLVCPYHGWAYQASGACVRVPQLPPETPLARSLRVNAYRCAERYGLVWVCLDEPSRPIPEFPEFDDPAYRTIACGPYEWQTSAERMVENFFDASHFAWVHPGILGDRSRPRVTPQEVQREGYEMRFSLPLEEPNEGERAIISGIDSAQTVLQVLKYRLTLPYTIHFQKNAPNGEHMILYFVATPLTRTTTRGYCLLARDYALDADDAVFQEFEDVIFEQDRYIVESQEPKESPLDLSQERHMVTDRVVVAYRRGLIELTAGRLREPSPVVVR